MAENTAPSMAGRSGKKEKMLKNVFKNITSQGIIHWQGEFHLTDKTVKILTCVPVVLE